MNEWDPNIPAVFICACLLLALFVENILHKRTETLRRHIDRFQDSERRSFDAMLKGRCLVCQERLENTLGWLDEKRANK